MCELSEEARFKNYELFKKKLGDLGIDSDKIESILYDKLINAPYAIDTISGLAYDGSLLNTVLRVLTPFALKINDLLPENLRCEKASIVKVCLLQHLAKADMFIPNDNEWEINKLGRKYKYSNKKLALKLGARSLAIAIQMNVPLTEVEVEAMTIIDKVDDEQAKIFANPLSVVIRQANELVTTTSIFKE